ncbi:EamA family transporter [Fluviispira vulneris]|uniref:EamA family transporter n=1 Tax=Fluviispira vulneris TaxID=2763012 RepID=UPI0036F35950
MWASGSVFVKIGLEYSSVWTFLFLRSFLSGLILFLISLFIKNISDEKIKLQNPAIINSIIAGFFLQFLYQTFFS